MKLATGITIPTFLLLLLQIISSVVKLSSCLVSKKERIIYRKHLSRRFDHGLPLSSLTTLSSSTSLSLSSSISSVNEQQKQQKKLNVAIVGAGPSGALLAHLLLKQNGSNADNSKNNNNIRVTLLESRSDPRKTTTSNVAYALGVGIRGRTAIRQVDEELWQSVRKSGYESERFQLHVGPFVVPLRKENDGTKTGGTITEPSLLMYQSELCATLVNELERRYEDEDTLRILFDTPIQNCDVRTMTIESTTTNDNTKQQQLGPFDLIVGCDGVNSVVRSTMEDAHPSFKTNVKRLPGEYKVVQMDRVPPNVDPKSVSLIIPKSGSTTAFVEPTDTTGNCCILFATSKDSGSGNDEEKKKNPIMTETSNVTAVLEALDDAFPQWGGEENNDDDENNINRRIAEQLLQRKVGSASSVECNTYNYCDKLALIGDAAHATGGVSGQGVNSALADASVLAKCILDDEQNNLQDALLSYSKRQVPEGKALYDLSFGPKPKGAIKKIRYAYQTIRDTLFRGKFGIGQLPLQTRLTTDLVPFATIRKEKDKFYDETFPSQDEFDTNLDDLHQTAIMKDDAAKTSKSPVDSAAVSNMK